MCLTFSTLRSSTSIDTTLACVKIAPRLDNLLFSLLNVLPRSDIFSFTMVNTEQERAIHANVPCSQLTCYKVDRLTRAFVFVFFSGVSRVFATSNLNWLPHTFTWSQYNFAKQCPDSTSVDKIYSISLPNWSVKKISLKEMLIKVKNNRWCQGQEKLKLAMILLF